jgi:hypothetical protein
VIGFAPIGSAVTQPWIEHTVFDEAEGIEYDDFTEANGIEHTDFGEATGSSLRWSQVRWRMPNALVSGTPV